MNFSSIKKATSGLGSVGTMVGIGAAIRMNQDKDNLGAAIAKEIPMSLLYSVMPMSLLLAGQFAPDIVGGTVQGMRQLNQNAHQNYKDTHKIGPRFTYQDTDQALTMRQASVQAIQGSKLNARNALGGEAALMHRGYGSRRA